MNDPGEALRKGYYTALNGNITVNSANVPVYDRVPNNIGYPFIKLSTQTTTDISDKTAFMTNNTIVIDIVTGYDGNDGGKADSDDIANQVLGLIRTRSSGYIDLTADGFNIVTTTLDSSNTIEENKDTHYIYRRVLTFRHIIHEV